MSQKTLGSQKLFSVRQVAYFFEVCPHTVVKWIKKGDLETIVLPGKETRHTYRIPYEVLLEKCKNKTMLDDFVASLNTK